MSNPLTEKDILDAVSQLGLGGDAMSIDGEFHGGQCCVYKVSLRRDPTSTVHKNLALRIPLHMSDREVMIPALHAEWETLQTLTAKGFPWSPRPLGCSLTFDNPVKFPFLVMKWSEGSNPVWDDESPNRALRDKFLGQLAAIQISLITCTIQDGSFAWRDFFERMIERKRHRIRQGSLPELLEKDCDDQEAFLPRVLTMNDKGGYTQREMAMDHGDIKPSNIIVDDEYNITGVIDWAFARMVPLPRAAGVPRYLCGSFLSPFALEDMRSYVKSFAAQATEKRANIGQFQDHEDINFCTMWMESIFSKGAHAALARNEWKLSHIKVKGDKQDKNQ